MTLSRVFICGALLLSSAVQAQFRKYSNEFLNIGVGARGLAMGSAQVASASDGTAGYWNPAGLAFVERTNINAMHAEYFSGIGKYDYLSFATPLNGGRRTLGVTALRFGVDDIPNTLFLVEPDGSINYNNVRSFSSADYGFLFSLAQKLKDHGNRKMQVGLNAKVIHRSVGSFAKAWGFGIDAGLQMQVKKWRLGLVGRDITTTFNTWSFSFSDKEKEALYLTNNDIPVRSTEMTAPRVVLGVGRDFKLGNKVGLLAEANFDLTFDGQRNTVISSSAVNVDPRIGVEANINQTLFLRAGVNNFQRALSDKDTFNQKKVWIYQPSLGAGFRLQNVRIDYAFTNLANQSSALYTHVFSLQLDLVNDKKRKGK
ncbi:PorV/PorQ family protein [Flaviaesturariibacter flavus]|uniref:PorV/PorQ family protein n=1 Tax=Flaviaesturariibacter flavus TaxID=2502780 RepID=A0A4R1BJZ7_9BACT|nr:PorV/PorQ family protein [Flaviaesturariibacter flavus]TCJ17634.1 PorV/PorQ family protein [Flaviaesturariibacter flavus]